MSALHDVRLTHKSADAILDALQMAQEWAEEVGKEDARELFESVSTLVLATFDLDHEVR